MLLSFIGIKAITNIKLFNKEVIKEKEINQIDRKQFAMYIEDGDSYKEYTDSDNFPKGYYLNIDKSKCEDINGKDLDVNNILSSKGNSVTVKSSKTIYCTLYFDYSETGEKDKPYRIQYIEDLVDLQVAVNNGETYEGKYFELTRNLDFQKNDSYKDYKTKEYGDINGNEIDEELKTELTTGRGWKPIGFYTNNERVERPFSGIFDGKNHKIDNLYIKNDIDTASIGLFTRIENAEIINLTIGGEIIASVNTNIGAFSTVAHNSKVNNCHNEVNITSEVGRFQVGGLIGSLHGESEVTNCTNKGNISNGNNTSGIVARIGEDSSNVKIENCTNYGVISNSIGTDTIGGIVGRTQTNPSNVTIINCRNYGLLTTGKSISNEQKMGGIIGIAGNGSTVVIENSDNYGEVRSEYNEDNTSISVNGGGIIGRVDGSSNKTVAKIINSHNHAEVNGMRRGGGLVGQVNSEGTLFIDKSYNEGNITSNLYVADNWDYDSCGGLIGLINNGKAYVLNTYNKGNISSQNLSVSGIIGNFNSSTTNVLMIINSYNIGNITNSIDKTSGIIYSFGNSGNGYVTLSLNNVYTAGTLSGTTGNYGLGNLGTNTQFKGINNVYHLNDYATSNISVEGVTTKSLNDMKNNTFVDLLNNNKKTINLGSIDSSLSEYSLCNWKLGESGYPELAC